VFDLDNLIGEKLAVALEPLSKKVLEPTVSIGPDGHPWFTAPGTTTQIRSHARRTLTSELTAA
jgi:hypothetical protein